MLDGIAAGDAKVREVRLAMLASGNWVPESIFPEHFKRDDQVEIIDDPGGKLPDDAVLDFSEVKWITPGEGDVDAAAEYARTMAAMADARLQTITEDNEAAAAAAEAAGVPFDPRGEWS